MIFACVATAMSALYATHSDRVFIGEGLKDMATEQDWQPIETAPKDGTEVLVWTLGSCEMQYHRHIASYEESAGWMGWTSIDGFPSHPTHWMLLPDPPTETGAK